MLSRALHRLRGHQIERKRRHWYDPPGEVARGPYNHYVCNCGTEWVRSVADHLSAGMWQF